MPVCDGDGQSAVYCSDIGLGLPCYNMQWSKQQPDTKWRWRRHRYGDTLVHCQLRRYLGGYRQ